MKCTLDINLSSNKWVDVTYSELTNTYEIMLNISPNDNLEEVLRRENFDKLLKEVLSKIDKNDEVYKYTIEGINKILKTRNPILDNSTISINAEEGIVDFIDNNPSLIGKQLIVNGEYGINDEDLNSLLSIFGNHKDYKVAIEGNSEYVTIEEYEKTVQAINQIVNKIKKYNLSPLEQIMYAYDLVRDRVYTKEGEDESKSTSRDLSKALLGDKIVCVGYAVIFEKVLDELGIKNSTVILLRKDKTSGHIRNMIFVDDPKYDIDGVYFFDATWDSKKKNSESSFLDSYKFFCKTRKEINKFDLINYTNITLEELDDLPIKFESIITKKGISSVPKKIIKQINILSNLIDGEDLINTFMLIDMPEVPKSLKYKYTNEELIEKVKYYYKLMNSDALGKEKLTKLLFNVRKIEYYENPSKYPFSISDFENAIVDDGIIDSKAKLLRAIFGDDDFIEFVGISDKMELEKMIEQVKLAKTLREVYENKRKR